MHTVKRVCTLVLTGLLALPMLFVLAPLMSWLPMPAIMERILPIPPIFLICCIWVRKSL